LNRLEFKNVFKTYDNKNFVLKDISFTASENDFLVLLGSSGCGKTTLLNLIAGLENITSGEIYIDSILVNEVEPKDRDIAMIFQNYALYPHMNIYDNIAFSLRNKKINEEIIREKVQKAANTLKIENLLDRYPNKISGGQKQRASIARAIVRNPKIFLMDEPLSSLDVSLRNEMREELKKIHNELKTTIIYVTHDQIEALTLATKIIVIDDGIIQQTGTPTELYNKPKNVFVAQFLGIPKMNIFENITTYRKGDEYYIKLFDNEIKINTKNEINRIDVGIRAENIKYDNIKRNLEFDVKIKYFELIGSEYLVYGEVDSTNIVFKLDSTVDIKELEDRIKIGINVNNLHFFDSITKERI